MIDVNEDITNQLTEYLNELILSHHPHLQPSVSRFPGSKTIDGIFGTLTLDLIQAGYALVVRFTNH